MYTPKYLRKWDTTDPAIGTKNNYMGSSFYEYFVGPVSQNRDSDCLEQSNFAVVSEDLEKISERVEIHRFGHWGPGWYEIILIPQDDEAALMAADEWAEKLTNYPLADEEDFSRREWESAQEYWENMDLSGRMEYCQEAGVSVFAARHEEFPADCFEVLTRV